MSVFLKGKNVDHLTRDSVEAFRYMVERGSIELRTIDLLQEAEESSRDIQEMLENGELTMEEAQQEKAILVRQINKEKHQIENGPHAERLDSPSSSILHHQNVLSLGNPAPQRTVKK